MSYEKSNQEVAEGLIEVAETIPDESIDKAVRGLAERVGRAEVDVRRGYEHGFLEDYFTIPEIELIGEAVELGHQEDY